MGRLNRSHREVVEHGVDHQALRDAGWVVIDSVAAGEAGWAHVLENAGIEVRLIADWLSVGLVYSWAQEWAVALLRALEEMGIGGRARTTFLQHARDHEEVQGALLAASRIGGSEAVFALIAWECYRLPGAPSCAPR